MKRYLLSSLDAKEISELAKRPAIDFEKTYAIIKPILAEIQKRLEIADQQMIIDLEDYGNTVSSTIPVAYKNLCSKNEIIKDDLVIFSGFGVGLSWGTILYRYIN